MRNQINICILLAVIGFFSSCNKLRDKWYHEYQHPQKEFDICRITEIYQIAAPSFDTRVGKFYYSPNGNLDSLAFSDDKIYYWTYDNKNQLIEFRESIEHKKDDYLTLHTYASANGRIVRDTSRRPGAESIITEVWSLEYDNAGRVVHETGYRIDSEAPGMQLPDRNYTYDANGNLASSHYERDNEINYLRTSKVLQFVHRDYSMNNFKQNLLGYNAYHLPVAFLQSGQYFLSGEAPSKLIYSCASIPPVPGSKTQCAINAVIQWWEYTGLRTNAAFYYTPDGRPMSIYYKDYINAYGPELHSFIYDKHDRLMRYEVNSGYPIEVHRYGYTGAKIASDTLSSERPEKEQFKQVSSFTYDGQGRIVKEDIHVTERNFSPASEFSSKTFSYDQNGNLVSALATAYDNKVSYLRTHPLWMFIHRNYSRNNAQMATGYNSKGLPLGFNKEVFRFFAFGDPLEIDYLCN